jgi:hypothetical protein
MDPVENEIRLGWALEAQEAAETLAGSLRAHVDTLVSEVCDLRARMTTLKDVQESLLAEKLAAEASLELLLREKAELSGENASLRAHARDMARSLAAYVAVDSLLAAATPPPAPGAGVLASSSSISSSSNSNSSAGSSSSSSSNSSARGGAAAPSPPSTPSAAAASTAAAAACAAPLAPAPVCTAACAELGARLSSARYLVVRLLELARGAGLLQSSSGVDLWAHLGRGMPATCREPLRGGLVMALAEAVGVASEMRAVAPGLPPADPTPTLLSDFQRALDSAGGGSGGGGASRDGSPAQGGEAGAGAGAAGAAAAAASSRGFLGSFLDLLVGDVEQEQEAQEELERAAAESTQEQRAAALKIEQIRAAIAQGVEMEEQLEQRKAQLLQP